MNPFTYTDPEAAAALTVELDKLRSMIREIEKRTRGHRRTKEDTARLETAQAERDAVERRRASLLTTSLDAAITTWEAELKEIVARGASERAAFAQAIIDGAAVCWKVESAAEQAVSAETEAELAENMLASIDALRLRNEWRWSEIKHMLALRHRSLMESIQIGHRSTNGFSNAVDAARNSARFNWVRRHLTEWTELVTEAEAFEVRAAATAAAGAE